MSTAAEPVQLTSTERKCPSCQAPIEFDPSAGELKCAYCSATAPVPRDTDVPVHALAEAHGYGAASAHVRALKCRNCGATSEMGSHAVASSCAFCGTPIAGTDVVSVPPSEGVVPFAVPKKLAADKFSEWIKGLWFRPSSLKKLADLRELRGVYVPGWSFEARAWSQWSAEAGYHYYETEEVEVNGKRETRQVQHTRWEHVSGEHAASYEELLVSASRGLRVEELDEVGPFEFAKALVQFHPDFLAGFDAESPASGAREAWPTAKGWIEEREYSACESDVPGDTHRNLRVQTETDDEAFQSVLVPVWIGAYAYGGKRWRVLVNGLTGKVAGDAPWSVWKLTFFALAVAAALVALYAFVIDPETGRRWLGH